jgi:hypothetical protein
VPRSEYYLLVVPYTLDLVTLVDIKWHRPRLLDCDSENYEFYFRRIWE